MRIFTCIVRFFEWRFQSLLRVHINRFGHASDTTIKSIFFRNKIQRRYVIGTNNITQNDVSTNNIGQNGVSMNDIGHNGVSMKNIGQNDVSANNNIGLNGFSTNAIGQNDAISNESERC